MKTNKWISVKDQLPICENLVFEDDEDDEFAKLMESKIVMIVVHQERSGDSYINLGKIDGYKIWEEGSGIDFDEITLGKTVTHWMPLPELPQK